MRGAPRSCRRPHRAGSLTPHCRGPRSEFTGAGLTFCGIMGAPNHRKLQYQYQHLAGRALVHLGAQRHGADDIQTGERNNLIIWSRCLIQAALSAPTLPPPPY